MNLFAELEGTKGERQAVAVLNCLLQDNRQARRAFLDEVAARLPEKPQFDVEGFVCSTEAPSNCEEFGKGWIDMVVQTGDAVIGVEAKLDAVLADDQPAKYLTTLCDIARDACIGRAVMVVLVPDWAIEMTKATIAPLTKTEEIPIVVLDWGRLLRSLEAAGVAETWMAPEVFAMWREHMLDYTGAIAKFDHYWREALGFFEPRGGEAHRTLMRRFWPLLPEGGIRLTSAKQYTSYEFAYTQNRPYYAWLGFATNEVIGLSDDATACRLCVYADYGPEGDVGLWRRLPIRGDIAWWWVSDRPDVERHLWVLDPALDEGDWSLLSTWQTSLSLLFPPE